MNHPLDGCRAKVERATEHVEELGREMSAFLAQERYRILTEFPSPTEFVARIELVTDPPLRLGTIVGDALNNLRAALDHLVWQLVIANNETPGRHSQFPIIRDPKLWEKVTHRNHERGPGPLKGIVNGLPEIEALQPYNAADPESDPLARLAELSNADKHRVLNAAFLSLPESENIYVSDQIYELIDRDHVGTIRNAEEPLKDGEAFFWLFFKEPFPEALKPQISFHQPVSIGFGDVYPPLTLERLRDTRDHVKKALQTFEPVFSSSL